MMTVKIAPDAPIYDEAFAGELEAEAIVLKATIVE
jgi:hypothetical protein